MESTALIELAENEQLDELEEIWLEVAENPPEEMAPIVETLDKLTERGEKEMAKMLLSLLLPTLKEARRYGDMVPLLRLEARLNPSRTGLREDLLSAYRKGRRDIPGIRAFLEKSGLSSNDVQLRKALDKLDRMMHFRPGAHLLHEAEWGVGVVQRVSGLSGDVKVDFEEKKGHTFPIEGALLYVKPLAEDSFLALRHSHPEKLREMEPIKLLKLVIDHRGGEIKLARLKKELMSSVIPEDDWKSYWKSLRKEILNDPYLELGKGGSRAPIRLLDEPVSYQDAIEGEIDAAPVLSRAIRVARKLFNAAQSDEDRKAVSRCLANRMLRDWEELDDDAPAQLAMAIFFFEEGDRTGEHLPDSTEALLGRLLRVDEPNAEVRWSRVLRCIDGLGMARFRRRLLELAKKFWPDEWPDLYARILIENPKREWDRLIDALREAGEEKLEAAFGEIVKGAMDHPGAFVNLAEDILDGKFTSFDLPRGSDLLGRLVGLIEILRTSRGGQGADKLIEQIQNLVGRDSPSLLERVLTEGARKEILELYDRIEDPEILGTSHWARMRKILRKRFPSLFKDEERPFWEDGRIYVTAAGLEKRQAEFEKLMNEDIPANSKAIGDAAALGDLSENAEWTAAIEEQQQLTEKAERMRRELDRAARLEDQIIETSVVMPGTRVRLKNLSSGEEEVYTVFGPWDVDIDNGIISYTAPLSQGLLGKEPGVETTVELPTETIPYRVEEIEHAFESNK